MYYYLHVHVSTLGASRLVLYFVNVSHVSYLLSEEEEDDDMDFSGVKTVNLQVRSALYTPGRLFLQYF